MTSSFLPNNELQCNVCFVVDSFTLHLSQKNIVMYNSKMAFNIEAHICSLLMDLGQDHSSILLCLVGELAGAESMTVDVCVSDM